MKQQIAMLNIGIADFAEPTMLILGDAKSLSWLADLIGGQKSIRLDEKKEVVLNGGITLHLTPSPLSGRFTRSGNAFIWEISAVEALKFVQQLHELVASNSPAHAYLDSDFNFANVQVTASMGEYDPCKIFTS